MEQTSRTVLSPEQTQQLCAPPIAMWVYRYENSRGDVLCVGTHAEPKSMKLSLGGFRIVPAARASTVGFSPEKEAIGLGVGMEEKAYWSKLFQIAGPRGKPELHQVVGGKCVLLPKEGGRVGEKNDISVLSWAVDCLRELEETHCIRLVTGQDLGHGTLSNGQSSLEFMSARYHGVVMADTSKPTGEGNYQMMRGVADALGLDWSSQRVGILGCGNIGKHLVERCLSDGINLTALEPNAATRAALSSKGVTCLEPADKARFLGLPLSFFAVNAVGSSLDAASRKLLCDNQTVRFVSGCENLVMPEGEAIGSEDFRKAKKLYVHTELCGMMGYLTAVENYLCALAHAPFNVQVMFDAAKGLRAVAQKVSKRVVDSQYASGFETAARELFKA